MCFFFLPRTCLPVSAASLREKLDGETQKQAILKELQSPPQTSPYEVVDVMVRAFFCQPPFLFLVHGCMMICLTSLSVRF